MKSFLKKLDIVDYHIYPGLTAVAVGLGAYDWRLALIVVGAAAFIVGVYASQRSAAPKK